MDLPIGLSDHLGRLARAEPDQPADLLAALADFAQAAAAAVPSSCGLRITLVQHGCPTTVTVPSSCRGRTPVPTFLGRIAT